MRFTLSALDMVVQSEEPRMLQLLLLREPAGSTAMSPNCSHLHKNFVQNSLSAISTISTCYRRRQFQQNAFCKIQNVLFDVMAGDLTSLVVLQEDGLAVLLTLVTSKPPAAV